MLYEVFYMTNILLMDLLKKDIISSISKFMIDEKKILKKMLTI